MPPPRFVEIDVRDLRRYSEEARQPHGYLSRLTPTTLLKGGNYTGIDIQRYIPRLIEDGIVPEDFFEWSTIDNIHILRANLGGVSLQNAEIKNSQLSGVSFEGADLSGTTLNTCGLVECDFRRANMDSIHFYHCDLARVDMRGHRVHNFRWTYSVWVHTDNLDGCLIDKKMINGEDPIDTYAGGEVVYPHGRWNGPTSISSTGELRLLMDRRLYAVYYGARYGESTFIQEPSGSRVSYDAWKEANKAYRATLI